MPKTVYLTPMDIACMFYEIEYIDPDPKRDPFDWAACNFQYDGPETEPWCEKEELPEDRDDLVSQLTDELSKVDPVTLQIRISQSLGKIMGQLDGEESGALDTHSFEISEDFEKILRDYWRNY